MRNRNNNICVVGADSAGHLVPILTLALQWQKKYPSAKIMVCTSKKRLENVVINRYKINAILQISGVRLSHTILGAIRCLVSLMWAFIRSLFFLAKNRPNHVISAGGILSIPVILAARVLRIRCIVYELNATPGRATKILAYFASEIKIVFASCKDAWPTFLGIRDKCVLERYPIRFTKKNTIQSSNIEGFLFFQEHRKTLFLLGGSQGSLFLNNMWHELLTKNSFLHESIQVIHQKGFNDQRDWCAFYKKLGIPAIIFSYSHSLEPYYHRADYIISRAGAGTLFEIAFFNKKALIVPLITSKTSHQWDNAHAMQKKHPELFRVLAEQEVVLKLQNTFLSHFSWDFQSKVSEHGRSNISQ